MRVAIGAVLNPTGGPARYAIELVRALGALEGDDVYLVCSNRPHDFAGMGPRVEVIEVPLPAAALEPVWDHVLLPRALRRRRVDLYHGIKGALPIALACPRVVTIHDLAIYACPETFAWQQHLHMRPHLRLAARQAAHVIADSAHARDDIARRLGIAPERITAVPLGVRADLFGAAAAPGDEGIARRFDLPPRYFLYTGTIQPRKNIDVVVRAYARLGGSSWPLLLAGRRRPDYDPEWLRRPPPGVRYLGAPSDDELAVLYRRAGVLVSPSSYEGFGLTALEAMASGCPVIGTAVTSIPEVVGEAALLLPRPDVGPLADAMQRVAGDDDLRTELARRGRARAATFTWGETARRTREVYRRVVTRG